MTSIIEFLIDILKLTAAGTAVFFIAYVTIKAEIDKQRQLKLLEIKKSAMETTLPLRLQAHERIVLFIERINPSNLLVRVHVPGVSVLEMQRMLIAEVQNEFQHNVTQQVYLSNKAWIMVRRLKDDTVSLINNSAKGLAPDAPSIELSKVVLSHLSSLEENPYEAALGLIKADLQDVF